MSRRYTEAELRIIFAKATEEEQAELSELGAMPDGFSLDEIKRIGAEVGIDSLSLERAARSVEPVGRGHAGLAGGPTSLSVERRVKGELGTVQASDILSVIRREMGSPGHLSELKGLLEWRSDEERGQRVITLSSNDGTTTVRGMADLRQSAVVTHVPAGLLGAMGSVVGFMISANNGHEVGMVLFATLLPIVMLAMRNVFARFSKSEGHKLERVVDELTTLLRESDRLDSGSTGAT